MLYSLGVDYPCWSCSLTGRLKCPENSQNNKYSRRARPVILSHILILSLRFCLRQNCCPTYLTRPIVPRPIASYPQSPPPSITRLSENTIIQSEEIKPSQTSQNPSPIPKLRNRARTPWPSATMPRRPQNTVTPEVLLAADEKEIIDFLSKSHIHSRRFDISSITGLDTLPQHQRDALATKLM